MTLLQVFFFSLPFLMALGLALAIVAFGGAVITRPVVPLMVYLTVFFVFAQSNYGSLDFRSNPVYARGTGQVFYPLLLWGLLVAVAWAWMGRAFARLKLAETPSILWWLLAWFILLLGHATWGLVAGEDPAEIFGGYGFAFVVWMAPLILLMVWAARGENTLLLLARALVVAALTKAVFGLLRWAFLGGDPSNVYQNYGRIDVKLTYFDIVDSLICALGVAVAVSLLFVRREEARNRIWEGIYLLTVVTGLLCVVLSYRRSAWAGLSIMAAYLIWRMRPTARLVTLVTGVPMLIAALLLVASQRLVAQSGTEGPFSFIFDLTSSRFGAESMRLLELRLAWESFADSPLLGIGAWGRYGHAHLVAWQQSALAGSFLHSGVLHLAMKTGLIGLVLFAGVVWAFVQRMRRMPSDQSAVATALTISGCAGLLFMLPDMLIGTPIMQLRTTQLLAFCLGLPFMVAATANSLQGLKQRV